MTMLGDLKFSSNDDVSQRKAFDEAIKAGVLSSVHTDDNFAGGFKYVGTHPEAGHGFVQRFTGRHVWGPKYAALRVTPPLALHVTAARERMDDVVKSLQEALKTSSAVESVAILPLIGHAANLRSEIGVLAGAIEQDAKNEFERPANSETLRLLRLIVDLDKDAHPGLATWSMARQKAHNEALTLVSQVPS